ncbi:MAG: hypothetical protein ACOYNY_17170 [Caldilineaceae bacterium]|jgi:hypothetical protein
MDANRYARSLIYRMMDYIKALAPEVHVIDEGVSYECELTNLAVYPPLSWTEEECDELHEKIGEYITDINIETGSLILVRVYSPTEQVTEMQHELVVTQEKIKSLKKRLQEAAAIGLTQFAQIESELVPV